MEEQSYTRGCNIHIYIRRPEEKEKGETSFLINVK